MLIQWLFKYSRQFQRYHGAKLDITQLLLIYFGTHLITVVYEVEIILSLSFTMGVWTFRFVSSVLCFIYGSPQFFCQQICQLYRPSTFSFYFPSSNSYPMTNSDTHAWLEPRYSGNDGVRGYASAVRGGHENSAGLPHTETTEPTMVTIKEFSVLLAFDHHRWKSGSRSTTISGGAWKCVSLADRSQPPATAAEGLASSTVFYFKKSHLPSV